MKANVILPNHLFKLYFKEYKKLGLKQILYLIHETYVYVLFYMFHPQTAPFSYK